MTRAPAGDHLPGRSRRGRPVGRGAGAVAVLLLVVVVAALVRLVPGPADPGADLVLPAPVRPLVTSAPGTADGRTSPSRQQTPTPDPEQLRLAALQELLDRRADAVLQRDRDSWLSTVDPASTEFAGQQAAVFDNLAEVPLAGWSYALAGEGSALPAQRLAELGDQDAWVARVVMAYQLQDATGGDVRRQQHLTVVEREGKWLLAGDQDGESAVDLWDLGPVQVVRGERSLLLGTTDQQQLAELAPQVDRAAETVDGAWGRDWPRVVVVHVPADQQQVAGLLSRQDETGLDQIAAVVTGELTTDSSATSADRMIINPGGFGDLGQTARQVVLAHETSHLATRASTTNQVPIWLSEGYADHVAYQDTPFGPDVVAAELLEQVRAGAGPAALPDEADFDPRLGTIGPAYSAAWLAVGLIAEQHGEARMLQFYRAVAGADGQPTGDGDAADDHVRRAFAEVLDTDAETFTQLWLDELERLAA